MAKSLLKNGIKWPGLFLFLLLSGAPALSQIAIQIISVGEAPVVDSEIEAGAKEDIAGTITFDGNDSLETLLQLAWRRAGEDTWRIHKQAILLKNSPGKMVDWKFLDVPLGSDFDNKKNLELIAFAVSKSEPLPEDIIDYQSLLYLCRAVSDPVMLARRPKNSSLLLIAPRVRIDAIAGQPFRPGALHEVGLQAFLYGEARIPTTTLLRVVVQPLLREEHWVIEDEPLVRQGQWSAKVDFTAYGFDEGSEFTVFAVITRAELPRGRGISLNEWRGYLQTHIVSVSPAARVIRTDIPLAQNQVGVRILSVDNISIDENTPREINSRSGMKGMLSGRPLQKDEAVWLLITGEFAAQEWRVLGKASIKNGRYWELSPQVLGGSGEYLRILAVVAKDKIELLNKTDIEENIAFSRPVRVITRDRPPLRVKIMAIDKQAVGGSAALPVYQVCGIEGEISGRPPEKDDKVWILKMDAKEKDSWELLGQAGFNSKHSWSLPPLTLGKSGEELILVAVVAKEKIETLNVKEQAAVLAASERVHVRLRE